MDESLKEIYRQSLPERIQELEAAAATVTTDTASSERARRIAHALRGSGGTYGFPEVSHAAAAVEDATETELPGHLRELLALLRRIFEGSRRRG